MIIRRKLSASYTAIPNQVITDTSLSVEARWMLCYLLTKPDHWVVRVADIQASGSMGRDRAYALLKELCEAGYVVKTEVRNEEGLFKSIEYVVYDEPKTTSNVSVSPFPENPYPDNPYPENPHHSKYGAIVSTDTLDTDVSKDARSRLWKKIASLSQETGIPEKRLRPIVGKWLKILNDNAEVLNMVIAEAEELHPADFVSWVTAAIMSRQKGSQSVKDWYDLWK